MKKWLTMLLALVMALSLFGCGGSGGSSAIVFNAKDADLTNAADAILEGNPQNIGGWKDDQMVSFPLKISKEANYQVKLEYSREGSSGIDLFISNDSTTQSFTAYLEQTAEDIGDWSVYKEVTAGTIRLTPDDKALDLMADVSYGDYVINLRKVTLTPVEEGAEEAAAKPSEKPAPSSTVGTKGGDEEDGEVITISGRYLEKTEYGNITYEFYDDGTFARKNSDGVYLGYYSIIGSNMSVNLDGEIMEWIYQSDDLLTTDYGYNVERIGDATGEFANPQNNDDDVVMDDYEMTVGLYTPEGEDPYYSDGYYLGKDGYAALTYSGEIPMGCTYEVNGDILKLVGPETELHILDAYTFEGMDGTIYTLAEEDADPSGSYTDAFGNSGSTLELYADGEASFFMDDTYSEGDYYAIGADVYITINDVELIFVMTTHGVLLHDEGGQSLLYYVSDNML